MTGFLAALLIMAAAAPASAAGKHKGEAGKIQAHVDFLNPAGKTTTDAGGITYRSGGWSYREPKVYDKKFWGTFPLYFMGQSFQARVTVTNTAAKGSKPFKVIIEALHNVLETDGSTGVEIIPGQSWTIKELRPGQSVTKYISSYIPIDPDIPGGLDVTRVRIRHLNQGQNPDAGLIKESVAVWCPPSLKDGQ